MLTTIHFCRNLKKFKVIHLLTGYNYQLRKREKRRQSFIFSPYGLLYLFIIIIFFYFIILYWFCHTLTCICHGCTRVPHPETPSHLPPQDAWGWCTGMTFLNPHKIQQELGHCIPEPQLHSFPLCFRCDSSQTM